MTPYHIFIQQPFSHSPFAPPSTSLGHTFNVPQPHLQHPFAPPSTSLGHTFNIPQPHLQHPLATPSTSKGCPEMPYVNCPSRPHGPMGLHGIVHPIPQPHGTFHGMSTCPSTDACVLLSIPSHGPMGSWDLSLTHEYLIVHPIPRSHASVK